MLAFSPKPVHYIGRQLLPSVPTAVEPAAGHAFAFFFFLILNFVLFVRPMELLPIPDLHGSELYLYMIVISFGLGFPAVLAQLRQEVLEKRPITLCIFGLLLAMLLSHLSHFALRSALDTTITYLKVVVYFLLFCGLVTTPSRLRHILNVVLWSVVIVAGATVLQYHGVISFPTIDVSRELGQKKFTGESGDILRLVGTGIFQDPNDMCVLLATAVLLGLYRLADQAWSLFRFLWLAPLALLIYAILLTHSRGGFLALLVGVSVLLVMRFGKRVGIVMVLLLIPGIFLGLSGTRQATFSTGSGTGHSRIELWSTGLLVMRQTPIFGVGVGEYAVYAGQVAHNSYLHAFVETGLLGGLFFLGACFLTMLHFYRLRRDSLVLRDPTMRQLVPYLAGVCATYCTGMMTLSLTYLVPTAMILAIGSSIPTVAKADPPLPEDRADLVLLGRLMTVSAVFLVVMYLFVRVSRMGGG